MFAASVGRRTGGGNLRGPNSHNSRMTNIAAILKGEISRLARKEIRSEISSLQKASAQHRKQIAAMRRQIESLERALKRANKSSGAARNQSPAEADSSAGGLRFRAAGLASHRKRLGLSAADFGRLIGVSGQSIYKWETGEVHPRRSQLEAIAAVRKMGRREAMAKLQEAA